MTPEERLIAYVRGRLGIGPDWIDNAGFAIGHLSAHLDIVEDPSSIYRRSTSFDATPYRYCIVHGTRHRLEAPCQAGIRTWAAANLSTSFSPMDDGTDIYIVLGTASYLTAWEEAVVRLAAEAGECVECARAGMACTECDPPKDDDHEPDPTDFLD